MINVNDLKPGITFKYDENIYIVIESQHSKSGRGQAHVKTKIKDLRSKAVITKTFTGGDKVEKAFIEQKNMQFLYADENHIFLMDEETFEQTELNVNDNQDSLNFLVQGSIVKIMQYNKEVLGFSLPVNVELKVVSVEPAVKGDSATSSNKKAVLETGLEIMVPMFIKNNEKIVVSTADKKYIRRA